MSNLDPEQIYTFLESLRKYPNATKAAKKAGINRTYVYEKCKNDPFFKEQMDQAIDIGMNTLEEECLRRASEGYEEPIFHKGEEVGSKTKYSDTLAIVLLKANKPEKYKDRYEANIKTTIEITSEKEAYEQLDQLDEQINEIRRDH